MVFGRLGQLRFFLRGGIFFAFFFERTHGLLTVCRRHSWLIHHSTDIMLVTRPSQSVRQEATFVFALHGKKALSLRSAHAVTVMLTLSVCSCLMSVVSCTIDCEACTYPITTYSTSTKAGELAQTRAVCVHASRLEVVVVCRATGSVFGGVAAVCF